MSGSWQVNGEGTRLAAAGIGTSPMVALKVTQGTEKPGVTGDWTFWRGEVRGESV